MGSKPKGCLEGVSGEFGAAEAAEVKMLLDSFHFLPWSAGLDLPYPAELQELEGERRKTNHRIHMGRNADFLFLIRSF